DDPEPEPLPKLRYGQENKPDWVRYLQELLNFYYQMQVCPQSGEFDATTANAVEHLRKQKSLEGDGSEVNLAVWQAIGADDAHATWEKKRKEKAKRATSSKTQSGDKSKTQTGAQGSQGNGDAQTAS